MANPLNADHMQFQIPDVNHHLNTHNTRQQASWQPMHKKAETQTYTGLAYRIYHPSDNLPVGRQRYHLVTTAAPTWIYSI